MRATLTTRFAVLSAVLGAAAIITTLPVHLHSQGIAGERTLYVSAVDARGDVVDGLGPTDFSVREDGTAREVLRVSRAIEPIDIALLVDNGSTAADAIPNIREGLKAFITSMGGQNPIALVTLADRPTIAVDYTTDPKRLLDGAGRIFGLSSSGVTLLDAIVEVSQGLEKRESPRAVMIAIVTDGVDYSNRDYREALEAISRAAAGLHTLTVGIFDFTNDDPVRNRSIVLDEGTRVSGGQRITLLTPNALEPTMRKLARELTSQYKVVYGRPQSLVPPAKVEVSSRRLGVTMRGTPARRQSGA